MEQDDFQIYTNPLFLLFDLENKLHKQLNEKWFAIYFSKSCYYDYRGDRLYVPFRIKIEKERKSFNEYRDILGFIPAFTIQLGRRNQMELTTHDDSNFDVDCGEDVTAAETALKEIYIRMNRMTGGEIDKKTTDLLTKFGIKYEVIDNDVVIEDTKTVITKRSLMLLPLDYQDYNVIYESVKELYESINKDRKQGRKDIVGYYVRKNKIPIDLNSQQHLAVVSDAGIYDIM